MARNLRQYLVDENTPVSPEWVRRVFGDIDARIDALEQIKADWQAAVDVLTSQALLRIDEALRPAFEELQQLASVGAFFTATSASDVALGTGLKTLIVDEPRKNFVPAEYVVVSSAGDPNIGMAGRLVSYDPETGELVINVELASGTGSRSDWRISVGTPPDLTHAGRTDNPHGVTPAQIGAAVEGHGHQISDVLGLQGALDAKAASVHGHQIADVSGLEAALAGKLDNTVAAFADRIDTLNENTAPNGTEFVPCSDGKKVPLQTIAGLGASFFLSGALAWPGGTGVLLSAAHGLGSVPIVIGGYARCISPNNGYVVGDIVSLPAWASSGECTFIADANTVSYVAYSNEPHAPTRYGNTWFSITSTSWDCYLWAITW